MLIFAVLPQIQSIANLQQYLLSSSHTLMAHTTLEQTTQITQFHSSPDNASNRVSFNEQISSNLGVTNRAQQAYFFEMAEFADDYQELELSFIKDDDNYQLNVENKDDLSFTSAIAKKNYATYKQWSGLAWIDAEEPLYSYISGIAYLKDNNTFQSILCVSKSIGKQELDEPKIANGRFTCSQGTEEIP